MNAPIVLTMDLLEDTIYLNEGVMVALDWPRQIQMLINEKEKMLLLRACTVDDQQAIVMPSEHTEQFEISGRSLLKKIRRIVDWGDNRPRACYGEYIRAHQAIRFPLEQSLVIGAYRH